MIEPVPVFIILDGFCTVTNPEEKSCLRSISFNDGIMYSKSITCF